MNNKTTQKRQQGVEYIPLDDAVNYFYSYDIALVAYLLCKQFSLAGLDKAEKGKVLFIIDRKEKLNVEIDYFWSCNTKVDAQTYFNQLRRLKNQIHSF